MLQRPQRPVPIITPFLVPLAAIVVTLMAAPSANGQAAGSAADHVILISIDGLRSDLIQQGSVGALPGFARLRSEGAYTLNARVDPEYSVTLPNHVGMLTGRFVGGVDGHGWSENIDAAPGETLHAGSSGYIASVFDVVHDSGGRTGLFSTKTKFALFDNSFDAFTGAPDVTGSDDGPDKLDVYAFRPNSSEILSEFKSESETAAFSFAALHFSEGDIAGHANGWTGDGVSAYSYSIRLLDHLVADLLDYLDSHPTYAGRTAVILTTDHGGLGTDHEAPTEPLNYTVPFFAWGAGAEAGGDLYALNPTRTNPGTAYLTRAEGQAAPAIQNADAANLVSGLLGLPSIPGSTINQLQDLRIVGGTTPPVPQPPTTVTARFQDGSTPSTGYQGVRDTKILSTNPTQSFGAATQLEADGFPLFEVLLGWDLTSLPQNGGVQSATVNLTVTNVSGDTYGLYGLNRDWSEGEATWEQAAAGVPWTVPGAMGADRDAEALGTFVPAALGRISVALNARGLEEVQRWMVDPSANHGFLIDIASGTDGVDIASSETGAVDERPELVITYSTDPNASVTLPPTAVFQVTPENPVAGTSATFDGSASSDLDGTITTYAWEFGDGQTGSGIQIAHVYAATGQYSTRLTVTDDDGQQSSIQKLVVVLGEQVELVAFQDGVSPSVAYAGTRDTKIKSDEPLTSFGSAADLEVDGSPDYGVLLAWDLGAVPPGATVLSASVRVSVFDPTSDAYELYALQRPWDEATASWNDASNGVGWALPGAAGPGDASSQVLGLLRSSQTGVAVMDLNENGLSAVQGWIDQPGTNFGILVRDYDRAQNGVDFHSREAADPGLRPALEISYTLQSAPANRISVTADDGGSVSLQSADILLGTFDPVVASLAPLVEAMMASPSLVDGTRSNSSREYRVTTERNSSVLLALSTADSSRVDRQDGAFSLVRRVEIGRQSFDLFRRTLSRGATGVEVPSGGLLFAAGAGSASTATATRIDPVSLPTGGTLEAYPNPFDQNLHIVLPNAGSGTVELLDVLGRRVALIQLRDGEADFSAEGLSSGTYFLRSADAGERGRGTSLVITKGH
ncbi:MAG: PKD repeat protein [Rhodothermales bacterium]|jgi:PKD repeat protein